MSFPGDLNSDVKEVVAVDNDCTIIEGQKESVKIRSVFALIKDGPLTPKKPTTKRQDNNKLITTLAKEGWIAQFFATIQFNCATCNKCKPLRIRTENFTPIKRDHKRKIKKNQDLIFEILPPTVSLDYYALFDRYLSARHPHSDMNNALFRKSFNEFRSIVHAHKEMAILRKGNKVVAVDLLFGDEQSIIGSYCFFDPELTKERSLGTYMDLRLFQYAKDTGRSYVYLGNTNRESKHLGHNGQYPNTEIYENGKWIPIEQAYPDLKQKKRTNFQDFILPK